MDNIVQEKGDNGKEKHDLSVIAKSMTSWRRGMLGYATSWLTQPTGKMTGRVLVGWVDAPLGCR